MINKNKFSIKDTKKVLHKVGKKWVVVSAVLLGLAAGGAAVTTANANAANTQAAQPQAEAQANHETAAEKTAANNTVTQPSRTAGLGTEFGGSAPTTTDLNDIVNKAKNKVSKKASSVKASIQQDSSDADVTNLTKLAKTIHGNTAASSAYQDLGNLAKSASNYSNISLGSDVANPSASTAFGMFSQVSNDFKAISNAQNTSNGQYYLSKITNLFNKASDYNSTISSNVDLSSQFPVNLSSHSFSYDSNSISLSGSITPTLSFNSNVSISIPDIINNGLNITSFVDSVATVLNSENSTPATSVIEQVEGNNDTNIYNQLKRDNLLPAANDASASAYGEDFYKLSTSTMFSNYASDVVNDGTREFNQAVVGVPDYKGYITKAKVLNALLNSKTPTADQAKQELKNATTSSEDIDAVKLIMGYARTLEGARAGIDTMISNHASTPYSSAVSSTLSSVANSVASFAGSLFATSSSTVGTSLNYSFGPFTNYNLSSVTSYINRVNGNLSSANSQLTSASSTNNMSNYISGLGFPETLGSTISGLVSTASNYVNKASGYVNDVTSGLNGFFKGKVTAPDYDNLINATKALPNDLQPTSNAASGSTEEAKLYSDYSNIADNTNNIDKAAMNHIATYNNGRVKRYVSDAARDATNSIVNEANSSAQSMSDETQSFNNAVTSVNTASENIATYKNKPDYTSAYNSAVSRVNNDSLAISAESSAYANSLANSSVNSSNASQFASDANAISLSSNTPVEPSHHHNTDNGGSGIPNIPNVPTNNNYVAPASASVSAEPISATTNNISSIASTKAPVANYVTVSKELQLHTSPNFTKKNGVAVIEPNTRLDLEKTVRANHGLARYEVNYKGKNYFITANKRYTNHISYALAKPTHYRYLKVSKALQLHTSPYFTKKNGVLVVKPNSEFRINRVVRAHGLVRYEVNYKGNVYFITANKKFSANAYLQRGNFRKHGYKAVKVVKPLNEYRKLNFAKLSFIRHFYRGSVLPIKKVITIANGEMTRLELTNGRYVTANKNFVEPIR